jgi:Na+-transporting methylmalonyl-CoA/oxaloacetate decarboxylase gamma subunit
LENLSWGFGMTVAGMGLVFALLALMWGLLALALRFDRPPATPAPLVGADASSPDAGIAPDVAAAIAIATLAHVAARRREAAPLMRSYLPGSLLFAARWVDIGRGRQNRSWQRRGR